LQAIPIRLRNFAQFFRQIQDKIDNHEWEIAIPQEQISRFDRFRCFAATNPKQLPQ